MFEPGIDDELLAQLLRLGYPRELSERGLAETKSKSLDDAIAWVLPRMSQEESAEVPKAKMESSSGLVDLSGSAVEYSASLCRGRKARMEDVVSIVPKLPSIDNVSYFAIFDGHGGDSVAKALAEKLLPAITSRLPAKGVESKPPVSAVAHALSGAYLEVDKQLREEGDEAGAGSTASTLIVTKTHFLVANVGDSRCILSRGGKAILMTVDDKPLDKAEKKRIERAGGSVKDNKVNGELGVSRAFGDFTFKDKTRKSAKKQLVVAEPHVQVLPRSAKDEFFIMASDGIWDMMSNDECCEFVRSRLRGPDTSLTEVCEALLRHCHDLGSTDNMSVIVGTVL